MPLSSSLKLLLFLIFTTQCHHLRSSSFQLKFLNEQILEKKEFQGLPLGGFSGLSFTGNNEFLVLSDDKKNHRYYKFALKSQPFKLILKEQILFKESQGTPLKRNMDPEGLALLGSVLFVSSEGQQIFSPPEPPEIFLFSPKGLFQKKWPVPEMFWNPKKLYYGAKENKGFESLTLSPNHLWTATEKPLKQDSFIRLSGFNFQGELTSQYPYFLDGFSGLTEMIWVKPFVFLTLERAYHKHKKKSVNEVLLFLTDCKKASSLLQLKSSKSLQPCLKKTLFHFKNLPAKITVDNLEGMSLGPSLSPTSRLLVFISDNNFNSSAQKNQILFFELKNIKK